MPIIHVVQYIHAFNDLFDPVKMTAHLQTVNIPFLAKCLHKDPNFQFHIFASMGLRVRLTPFAVCPCAKQTYFMHNYLNSVVGLAATMAVEFPPGHMIGVMTEEELRYYNYACAKERELEASMRTEREAVDTMVNLANLDLHPVVNQQQEQPQEPEPEQEQEQEQEEPVYRPRTQNSDDGVGSDDDISSRVPDSHETPTTTAARGSGNDEDMLQASQPRELQPPPKYKAPKVHVFGRKRSVAPKPVPWDPHMPSRAQSV